MEPYKNCALAKIEDSFLASMFSDDSPNNPNTTKIFKRIRRELFPKSYAEFWKKKFTSKSKNSVPKTPNRVKNTIGNKIIDLPNDFENKYEKLKQSDAPKTKPKFACVSSLSRNP